MLLGLPQSIATLLTIILFYAMDFARIPYCDKKEVMQPLGSPLKLQTHCEA